MKHRVALLANGILAAIATVVMTSACVLFFYRPEIPEELKAKQ